MDGLTTTFSFWLALVLSVGLGSKELVSRSLEREVRKPADNMEPFRHL